MPKRLLLLMGALITCAVLGACAGQNSSCPEGGFNSISVKKYSNFTPGKLWLDNNGRHINAHGAGFLYDNGRYYMFGEHKLGGALGNKALVGVHCYSSDDLYNWKDEGIAFKMSRDPESKVIIGTVLERPKVLYNPKTKKYVMFFHLEFRQGPTKKSLNIDDIRKEKNDYSAANIGFAVADKITGPYKFVGSTRLHANKFPVNASESLKKLVAQNKNFDNISELGNSVKNGTVDDLFAKHFKIGQTCRDFTAFLDDDGKAYIISASEGNGTLYVSELNDDFLGFTGKYTRNLIGGFHEAPAIFKTKGKYYMFSSHCTGWNPNPGRVSVSDNIMGEWRELGNPCRGEGQVESSTYRAAKADTTFRSQSTYVIPVQGKADAFIYFGDRWHPYDAMDGRYIMLPVEWEGDMPVIRWRNSWNLSFFDSKK